MPDADGRIPPVPFNLTDAEWHRIFGTLDGFNRERDRLERVASARLDVSADDGGEDVQDPQPPEDAQVRGVRETPPEAPTAEAHGGHGADDLRGVRSTLR